MVGRLFEVGEARGEISLLFSPDREEASLYSFSICVSDHGQPPLSAVTRVSVSIRDTNDCQPQFEHANYEFYVQVRSSTAYSELSSYHSYPRVSIGAPKCFPRMPRFGFSFLKHVSSTCKVIISLYDLYKQCDILLSSFVYKVIDCEPQSIHFKGFILIKITYLSLRGAYFRKDHIYIHENSLEKKTELEVTHKSCR